MVGAAVQPAEARLREGGRPALRGSGGRTGSTRATRPADSVFILGFLPGGRSA